MKESLLWSISKGSVQHYLLGTMHVKSEKAFGNIDIVKKYIDKSQFYIGEMNLNDPNLELIQDYFLLEDANLKDLLSEKKYNKIHSAIQKGFGIDLDMLAHYKPLVISNMLGEAVLTQEYDMALDHYLWAYALEQDKTCLGLESAEDQFRTMVNIPMDFQLQSLIDCCKDTQKFRKKILKLSAYYEEGRLNDLYKATYKSMGELRKLMIFDRNKAMTEALVLQMNIGSCFCAVGAAHLAGNKGILALLKKKGYKVKPLTELQ